MKLHYVFGLLTILATSVSFAGSHHGGHMQHKAMSGALHPMPNLMRVVMKHGDQLDLIGKQSIQLTEWRDKSHGPMQAKVKKIQAIRTAMQNAVIDGASHAEVSVYLRKLEVVRAEIMEQKLKCRNNMRSLLNDEQWQKVSDIYRSEFM